MDTSSASLSAPAQVTRHAQERCEQRDVPACVLRRLEGKALRLRGHPMGGRRVNVRAVRIHDGYWVAPTCDGHVITVYFVANESIHGWARRRLANVGEAARLRKMPVHRTDRERVTDELVRLWC